MIEIAKACKVAFMKARDSSVVRYKEERINWQKKDGERASKSFEPIDCSWINKVVYGQPSVKWTS